MNTIKFNENEAKSFSTKLEYRFKKTEAGTELISKLQKEIELNLEEATLLLKRLEYHFKRSNQEVVNKLKKFVNTTK